MSTGIQLHLGLDHHHLLAGILQQSPEKSSCFYSGSFPSISSSCCNRGIFLRSQNESWPCFGHRKKNLFGHRNPNFSYCLAAVSMIWHIHFSLTSPAWPNDDLWPFDSTQVKCPLCHSPLQVLYSRHHCLLGLAVTCETLFYLRAFIQSVSSIPVSLFLHNWLLFGKVLA